MNIIVKNKINYKPKVSVIIPVYNVEKYLRECLDSVINQTLKEIEIICIDDGSTDNSLEILKEYAEKDNRFTIITQKNMKQGTARNSGLKIAKGEYVFFIDSDDYIDLNACDILYNHVVSNSLDLLQYSGVNFDNCSKHLVENEYWKFVYLPKNFNTRCFNYKDCYTFFVKMAVSCCLTIYKLDFLKKYNILFPEKVFFEDNLFFTHAMLVAKRCGILNKELYYRRLHSQQTTHNINKKFTDYVKISKLVKELVQNLQVSSKLQRDINTFYKNNILYIYKNLSYNLKIKYYSLIREYVSIKKMYFIFELPILLIEEK